MSRIPKIAARLAPMRSCMMADCLRSTQVKSPPTLSTNSITKATRPKAMPRSATPRLRRRHHLAAVAHALVGEAGERRHGLAERPEPVFGPLLTDGRSQRLQHPTDDLPVRPRLAQR